MQARNPAQIWLVKTLTYRVVHGLVGVVTNPDQLPDYLDIRLSGPFLTLTADGSM